MIATIIGIVLLVCIVTYLLLRPKASIVSSTLPEYTLSHQSFIKESEEYELSFDHCDFKDASYLSEVETRNRDLEVAAILVGTTAGYYTPVERVETVQSVLFYQNPNILSGKRLYQTFPLDVTTLKFHALQGNVKLYLHKLELDKYVFVLNQ
jgi:hypothetical protein